VHRLQTPGVTLYYKVFCEKWLTSASFESPCCRPHDVGGHTPAAGTRRRGQSCMRSRRAEAVLAVLFAVMSVVAGGALWLVSTMSVHEDGRHDGAVNGGRRPPSARGFRRRIQAARACTVHDIRVGLGGRGCHLAGEPVRIVSHRGSRRGGTCLTSDSPFARQADEAFTKKPEEL
jgi:hypothetical protein